MLVTHHVEEIMPAFSHVLMLKGGRVLAAGKKAEVLTASSLSLAFDTRATLGKVRGRYHMSVSPKRGAVV